MDGRAIAYTRYSIYAVARKKSNQLLLLTVTLALLSFTELTWQLETLSADLLHDDTNHTTQNINILYVYLKILGHVYPIMP